MAALTRWSGCELTLHITDPAVRDLFLTFRGEHLLFSRVEIQTLDVTGNSFDFGVGQLSC